MGRKIEMKLIPCKHARLVAFAKRRPTVLRKARELRTLTGCEIAVIVISQSGRPYSFGTPSVESVVQRFMNETRMPIAQPAGGSLTSGRNQEYVELCESLNAMKQKVKKLAEDRRRAHVPFWLGTPIHELYYEQLIKAKESLDKMIKDNEKKIAEISQRGSGKRSSINANVPDLNFPPNDTM